MRTKISAMFATLVIALGLSVAGASPASAGTFSEVYHAGDDSGYTAPIRIECEDPRGERHWLYTGQGSPSRCGAHTRYIIVGSGQTVRCTDMTRPWEGWLTYYTGVNYITSYRTLKCYMQRAL